MLDIDVIRMHRDTRGQLLQYALAIVFAIPIGTLLWFELGYLWFGLTGKDVPNPLATVLGIVAYAVPLLVVRVRATRPAIVVRRGCRLGLVVTALLPVVSFGVLMLWESATNRADLGMGGLMLYALPYVSLGVACVLGIVFAYAGQRATLRLSKEASGSS